MLNFAIFKIKEEEAKYVSTHIEIVATVIAFIELSRNQAKDTFYEIRTMRDIECTRVVLNQYHLIHSYS